jgi:hypothetical protein
MLLRNQTTGEKNKTTNMQSVASFLGDKSRRDKNRVALQSLEKAFDISLCSG